MPYAPLAVGRGEESRVSLSKAPLTWVLLGDIQPSTVVRADVHGWLPFSWRWGRHGRRDGMLVSPSCSPRARRRQSAFPGHLRVSFLSRACRPGCGSTLECLPHWRVGHLFIHIADAWRHAASSETTARDQFLCPRLRLTSFSLSAIPCWYETWGNAVSSEARVLEQRAACNPYRIGITPIPLKIWCNLLCPWDARP